MKNKAINAIFSKIISVIFILFFVLLVPQPVRADEEDIVTVRGKIVKIVSEDMEELGGVFGDSGLKIKKQILEIKILRGEYKGETVYAQNIIDERMAYNIFVDEGDEVLLHIEKDDMQGIANAYVADIYRQKYLVYLLLAFLLLLVLFGGFKGIKAVITLGLTGLAVVKILLPLILQGKNPILVSVPVCAGIIAVTLIIISGFNKKTFSAIFGTTGGVLIAGGVAYFVGSVAKLTGLGNDEAQMLMFLPQQVNFDFKGLLFSGIILGALGAIMDVGMSIASAMHEIEAANPEISNKDLIKSGMNVGRDIMGTMSNTLILAYAGGSLHLMLLLLGHEIPMSEVINWDMMASEVVRALAGSIGLVFAIPITAVISGTIGRTRKNEGGKK